MQRLENRELVLCALFIALITVGTFIRIPVGADVFTLQFMFTLLAGLMLGARLGAIAVGSYILLGLIGVPVFASGGGPSYVLQPSFGYLLGFFLQAWFCGKYARRLKSINLASVLKVNAGGMAIVYVIGLIWFYVFSNYVVDAPISVWATIFYCGILQIGPDFLLCIGAAILGVRCYRAGLWLNLQSNVITSNKGLEDEQKFIYNGTGTDVGKTYVTALLVKKLRDYGIRAGYYKAALSGAVNDAAGNLQPGDACHVVNTAGLNDNAAELVSYIYSEPISPHLAAKINHEPIELAKIRRDFSAANAYFDYVTVEGSGGIICPLRWDDQRLILDDVVKALNLNVVIVADAGLGTINATVLTIEHLNKRHIPIKGVILNNYVAGDIMQADNEKMIEEMTGVKVVAKVGRGDTDLAMDFDDLIMMYD